MKPCSKNRRLIAWLALDTLEPETATVLRKHLATCDGCRFYFNELSKVTATLRAAEIHSEIQATASFHRRVVAAVKAQEARSITHSVLERLRTILLDWRVALPVVGGLTLVLLVGLLVIPRPQPQATVPTSAAAQKIPERSREADFSPTIANYQMVANRSFDKLDELLTEQASRKLPPAPIYTASAFTTKGLSD